MVSAYWYRDESYFNLGDEVSDLILDRRFGVEVDRSSAVDADLVAAGSTLGWVLDLPDAKRSKNLHVVGSGFMHPKNTIQSREKVKVHSVRGYLSKIQFDWMDQAKILLGDPGLLASKVARVGNSSDHARVGLVPHHSKVENPKYLDRFSHLNPKVIDIRTRDIDGFLTELASCELVISQSLHGLIFADSIGIPSVWSRLNSGEGLSDYKYLDYFSSVNRPAWGTLDRAPHNLNEAKSIATVASEKRVAELQSDIEFSFEKALSDIA